MKVNIERPEKLEESELFKNIEDCIATGSYVFTNHGLERSIERNVPDFEVIEILKSNNKWHEENKDVYMERHNSWNYSIRGETLDEVKARIAISFKYPNLLIVTVIALKK